MLSYDQRLEAKLVGWVTLQVQESSVTPYFNFVGLRPTVSCALWVNPTYRCEAAKKE